jgi:predicted anti-sigma-YlaC factor YlaD
VRQLAVDGLADALGSAGAVYASDEDPDLVRDALPFALKTMEALLVESPQNGELLLATASGFTQYAYAFVETDALLLQEDDYAASEELSLRARRLYLRSRDYGLRALELRHPGIAAALRTRPFEAAAPLSVEDVPAAYWTGAAWGKAIAQGLDEPALVADIDAVRALLGRALELDEDWSRGAVHEALIGIEALPELMGGSPVRAREHFARAVEISGGASAGAFVTLAVSVALPGQDREEFDALLERALAIDPAAEPALRLSNLVTQRRARHYESLADELFLD